MSTQSILVDQSLSSAIPHSLVLLLIAVDDLSRELEVFIEHIPRAECLQCSYNRRDISAADAHRTGGIAFVYGHIQGVGVTAYRIHVLVYI